VGCRGGAGRCATPAEAPTDPLTVAITITITITISVAVADSEPDVWFRGGGQP
jgi:hypothetical protein